MGGLLMKLKLEHNSLPTDIPTLRLEEILDKGILQEVNRRFFNPLGLALEIVPEQDSDGYFQTAIWDFRNDPQSATFDEEVVTSEIAKEKRRTIESMLKSEKKKRMKELGYQIQPTRKT
jgi:hypothetical protein